ncbi:MAG: imidazole glycerol phosphate synthase subunit HisH [Planctomycetota bacterium]|nr:MAG: imidazole glycerol phosphate synthase subunit HisH [Planctomycetota bacterium]
MGNLRSVEKAIESVGGQVVVTDDPDALLSADKIVLPGVGACGDALAELRRRGLTDALLSTIASGKPFLGICLGLQMLFEVSYEGGRHQGLGVIPGEVVRFPFASTAEGMAQPAAACAANDSGAEPERPTPAIAQQTGSVNSAVASSQRLKVPHMGWNRVRIVQRDCPLMQGIDDGTFFYFVHSYFVAPRDPAAVWLETEYGIPFCAAVWKDNLFATQFHPEKSQRQGLQMLRNFVEL